MKLVTNPSTGREIADYTGRRFGHLVALEPAKESKPKNPAWVWRCDCGNVCIATARNVVGGRQTSCGCRGGEYVKNPATGGWIKNLKGQSFGQWTVIEIDATPRAKKNDVHWICRCSCGTERSVSRKSLTSYRSLSCGECTRPQAIAKAMKKRVYKLNTDIPAKNDRLYHVWGSMKARCLNKNAPDYPRYGGRGITICDEWKNSFPSFKEWALSSGYDYDAPRMACTLDRIDNDGPYSPDNCQWVSMKKQIANQRRPETPTLPDNRRKVALVNDDGVAIKQFESAAEAARETGCDPSSIGRVCMGKQKTARGLRWRYIE